MSLPILIIGKSGSGKSASLRNFKADEVDIINVESKPLPFRNNFVTIDTDDYKAVCKAIKNSKKKVVVVDDAGYLITNAFMRGHASQGAGNAMFNFYNQLADNFWKLITYIKSMDKDEDKNKIVYIIMHDQKNDYGDIRPKTIGKLLDDKVCVEGMFTICLRSMVQDGRFVFRTRSDGFDVTKTPIGLFDTEEIDNDLHMVDEKIREYYGLVEVKKDAKD